MTLPRRIDDKTNPKEIKRCLWLKRSPNEPKISENIERRATWIVRIRPD